MPKKLNFKPLAIMVMIISSLLLGGVITSLSTASKQFVTTPCDSVQLNTAKAKFNLNNCASYNYGFPAKFISSNTVIALSTTKATGNAINVGGGSSVELKGTALTADLALWTAASFVLMYLVYIATYSTTKKSKK